MQNTSLRRNAAALCIAAVLLAGCAGSQPPIGAPGVTPQRAHRATSGDLIYATGGCGGVCVLSYPDGTLVEKISVSAPEGDCADRSGNVFITDDTQVLEYAHGGMTPIATLTLPGGTATGCAVDPITGNLAVVFNSYAVAVFANETGSPTVYSSALDAFYCGYDNAGNLFVSGYSLGKPAISELPKGQQTATILSVNAKLGNPGQTQWDGRHMTFESRTKGNIKLLRFQISGSTARVVGMTRLKDIRGNANQSWLDGDRVLVPYGNSGQFVTQIGVWQYPKAGKSEARYRHFGTVSFLGVTLSVAPTAED